MEVHTTSGTATAVATARGARVVGAGPPRSRTVTRPTLLASTTRQAFLSTSTRG